MIAPLIVTMVFSGLLQGLAMWSLASRWLKISVLYGLLGLAYWLILFIAGKTPATLLRIMPVAGGIAFVGLFVVWFIILYRHRSPPQS